MTTYHDSPKTSSWMENCTKFGQLILSKIIKIVATSCQISRIKCTKFDFGWGREGFPVFLLSQPGNPGSDRENVLGEGYGFGMEMVCMREIANALLEGHTLLKTGLSAHDVATRDQCSTRPLVWPHQVNTR